MLSASFRSFLKRKCLFLAVQPRTFHTDQAENRAAGSTAKVTRTVGQGVVCWQVVVLVVGLGGVAAPGFFRFHGRWCYCSRLRGGCRVSGMPISICLKPTLLSGVGHLLFWRLLLWTGGSSGLKWCCSTRKSSWLKETLSKASHFR